MKPSLRFAALLICISIFLYVKDPYRRLQGHWHLSAPFHESVLSLSPATFDFKGQYGTLRNGSLYNSPLSMIFDRIGGDLNITASECYNSDHKYKLDGDSLRIYSLDGMLNNVAYKCDEGCCDLQKDYFFHSSLDIDLPIASDTSDQLRFQDSRLGNALVISEEFEDLIVYARHETIHIDSLIKKLKSDESLLYNQFYEEHFLIFADRNASSQIYSVSLALFDIGIKDVSFVKRGDTDLKTSFKMYLEKIPIGDTLSQGRKCNVVLDESLQRYVYNNTDVRASHLEGDLGLMKKFFRDYRYPNGEIQGSFLLELFIDEDGTLLRTGIYNKRPEQFSIVERSIVQFISTIERWKPGECDGKKVLSVLSLPLNLCQ